MKKSERVSYRFTKESRNNLDTLAKHYGVTATDWLERAIKRAVKRIRK